MRAGNSFYREGTVVCTMKSDGILENLDCPYEKSGIFEGKDIRECSWLSDIPKERLEELIAKIK